ncbi:hypothetical protein EGM88_14765 [Aureibaculum marinum]|uniref:Uncharacterized protein n=1 Tax=Aureibaculum marinum TaxID=2487930 RepID=A0A3N4N7X1_9FLAO|nr:hypothetical protein [Aureibaculum marinum]RPD91198.1 hypothetical protein EGM88_14765 [Aureibaculum marinum]
MVIIGLLILLVVTSNYTSLKTVFKGLPVYNFATEQNKFKSVEIPWKGVKFQNTVNSFEKFEKENLNTNDSILYRTFKINPLKFWNWHEYITHPRYKLPYKSKEN